MTLKGRYLELDLTASRPKVAIRVTIRATMALIGTPMSVMRATPP